jgi:hypothetical protein
VPSELRAAVATASYIVAILVSLLLFLYSTGRALQPSSKPAARSLAVACGALVLFCIAGGYIWFRVMSVFTHGLPGA